MFREACKKPVYEFFGRPKKVADVGIELEVEGQNLPAAVPHWQSKPEGSLQDGVEYITKPIKADVVKQYVDGLNEFITKTIGATIKPSYRCSTHIHMNVLPETIEDVLGILVIFTMFEPVLLKLCGPNRDGNLFCLSSYDTGDMASSFEKLCSTLHNYAVHGWGYERGKYSALNTGRLFDLGTLEARCFPLSVDGSQVSEWVSWLLRIRDMAKAEPDKTYRSLWKNVRQNPVWYGHRIFGPKMYSVTGASDLIDMGTENAYELTKILKKFHSMTDKPEPSERKARLKKMAPLTYDDLVYAAPQAAQFGSIAPGSVNFAQSTGGSWTTAAMPQPENEE